MRERRGIVGAWRERARNCKLLLGERVCRQAEG